MSYVTHKLTYRVFCSHTADYPQEDLNTIQAVCAKLSNEESSANFEFRDMYTAISDDEKSAKSLIGIANKSDIFLRLIHEVYGSGSRREYIDYQKAKKKRMKVFTFIRVDSEKAKELAEDLKASDTSGAIKEYDSLGILENEVKNELEKYRDEQNALRNKKKKLTAPTLFILILAILALLYWKQGSADKNGVNVPAVEVFPPEGDNDELSSFKGKIDEVESLIHRGDSARAKSLLDSLSLVCKDDWDEEKHRIDSLKRLLLPTPPSPPNLPGPSKPSASIIEERTYEIIGVKNPFRGYIVSSINNILPNVSQPSSGMKERWTISVEQDLSVQEIPKIIDSDEYMVDIEFSILVTDNQTSKRVFENSFSTRGRSSASIEDARKHSHQLAAQEIAEQIKPFMQ